MLKKALIIAQDLEYKRRPEQVSWFCILKLLKEQGLKVYVIVPYSKSRFDPERYSYFVKELKKVSDGFYIYSKKKNLIYFFHPFIPFISFRNSFTKLERKEIVSFCKKYCGDVDVIFQDHIYSFEITRFVCKNLTNNDPLLVLRTANIEKDFAFYHSKKYSIFSYQKYMGILDGIRMILYEDWVIKNMDLVLSVSTADTEYLQRRHPGKEIMFFPHIYTVGKRKRFNLTVEENKLYSQLKKDFKNKKVILFINNFSHGYSLKETFWFIEKVFPLIRKELPETFFLFGGYNANQYFRNLFQENICVFSDIQSVKPYMKLADLIVILTNNRVGVKSKFIEAVYFSKKVISTVAGSWGSGLEDVSFSTDDPRKFAELCIEALKNKLDFQPLFKKFEEIYNVEKNFSKVIDKIKKMKKTM